MNYYIDESGTTGDLINKKFDLFFANQPIFTHACIGVKNAGPIVEKINKIKIDNNLPNKELKCEDLYFKRPDVILEIIKAINEEHLPLICEVMDKKYQIAVSIANHIIWPSLDIFDTFKSRDYAQKISDVITIYAEDLCFKQFYKLCSQPCESNLLNTFAIFYDFFKRRKSLINDNGAILKLIEIRKKEYFDLKEIHGEETCIKWFYPIPDIDTFDNQVALLPNVHSFYHILARINKYHLGDIKEAVIYHDTQKEYSKTLNFCCQNIRNNSVEDYNTDPRSDYNIKDDIHLEFIDSETSHCVQLADIVAGFLNRFINGTVYKNIDVLPIYNEIFERVTMLNRLPHQSPLGTNFVLPVSLQNKFMPKFGF